MLDELFAGVSITRAPEKIAAYGADAYAHGLYRHDGVAQFFFRGDTNQKVYAMAYIPGVAWIMYHDYFRSSPRWSAFTREDMRCQGIMHRLWEMAQKEEFGAGTTD